MPRPIKCRKVCHFPDILEFRPSNKNGRRGEEDEKEVILLTVDEYETIRLIDKEGYSQEQCAGFMRIQDGDNPLDADCKNDCSENL